MKPAVWLAGVVLAGALAGANAQNAIDARDATSAELEMTLPRITPAAVDWDAVRGELAALPALQPDGTGAADESLDRLNEAAGRTFAGIRNSGVPVLLPVDLDNLLQTPANGEIAGFRSHFFMAGATGYDAAFTVLPAVASAIAGFEAKQDPMVLISASSVLYELDPPVAPAIRPSKELEQLIPGIRRRWLENYLRYSFERYGVTYTVAMLCVDGGARRRLVSCDDAANVIVRFIKSLRLAGGAPQPKVPSVNTIERPSEVSSDFTYHPAGNILPNTGFRGHGGRADTTVYARIRFPLAQAPSYANSQSFLNWGNCDFTGRTRHSWGKGAPYRCRVNNKPLVFDESARENRSYPWRDNFCEHRRYFVGQCAGGEGHQGQDIRPATCQLRNPGSDRCIPFRDDIVAVRDGMLMRFAGRESVYLFVNAPGERLRFRYLHMHPRMLDADGVVSGRAVREGEVLGKVGNYDRIPNGTTYHLHFEMQVPTRDGWVFVNPYMTLVTAYERLIGGRGRQINDVAVAHATGDEPPVSADAVPLASAEATLVPAVAPIPKPRPVVRPSVARGTAARALVSSTESAKPPASRKTAGMHPTNAKANAAARACKETISAGSGGRDCASRLSRSRAGAKPGVRKLGEPIPVPRAGARRVGADVHARDARPQARHVGVRASQ